MKQTKIKVKLIALLLAILCLAALAFWLGHGNRRAASLTNAVVAQDIYEQTLVVAADIDFDPYSFLDENGNPAGYDVELVRMLARELGMNVRFELMEWSDCMEAIQSGTVDIICGMDYLPNTYPELLFSTAVWSDPFVCFGKKSYSNIADLADMRLATIENSGCFSLLLEPYKLVENTTTYPTYTEALSAVARGEEDYAIVRYSVGRRLLAAMNEKSVRSVGPNLGNNPNCLAVNRDDPALQVRLNQAIQTLKQDGTLNSLAEKWLGTYVQRISARDFFNAYGQPLLVAAIVVLAGLMALQFRAYKKRVELVEHKNKLDVLTELWNKKYMENKVRYILEQAGTGYFRHALLVLDVDGFKLVNDRYGHVAGDIVLRETAERLQGFFHKNSITGRFGGDEFVVFLECIPDRAWLDKELARLNNVLAQPVCYDSDIIPVSASIGAALMNPPGVDYDTLFATADKALYTVKHNNKNGSCIVEL